MRLPDRKSAWQAVHSILLLKFKFIHILSRIVINFHHSKSTNFICRPNAFNYHPYVCSYKLVVFYDYLNSFQTVSILTGLELWKKMANKQVKWISFHSLTILADYTVHTSQMNSNNKDSPPVTWLLHLLGQICTIQWIKRQSLNTERNECTLKLCTQIALYLIFLVYNCFVILWWDIWILSSAFLLCRS